MHTIDQLQQSFEIARQLGYEIRQEWLDGSGGGSCEFGGRKWIFVDLSLSPPEQLEQVTGVLRDDLGATEASPAVIGEHGTAIGRPPRSRSAA